MSAKPCGCDPDCKTGPYVCTYHAGLAKIEEANAPRWKGDVRPPEFGINKLDDQTRVVQYSSGAKRDTADDKIDYDRVFDGPLVDRLATHLTKANVKYPDAAPGVPNWTLIETEEELVRYRKGAVRHFRQWRRGDRDEDHFAAVVFNMNGYEHCLEKMKKAKEQQ